MASGLQNVGFLAVELMERLEDDYKDMGGVRIGTIAVVVEVNYFDNENEEVSAVEYRCSDGRRWVQHGFLSAACRAVVDSSEEADGP